MDIKAYKDTYLDNWDHIVQKACNGGSLLQSIFWAKVIKRLDGATPYFFYVYDYNTTVARALVMKRFRYDRTNRRKSFPLPYLECLDGPAFLTCKGVFAATKLILETAVGLARKKLCTHIQINPPHLEMSSGESCVDSIYQHYGFKAIKCATYLIDLKPEEDRLFMNIKKSARKCVNRGHNLGLTVRKIHTFNEFRDRFWKAYTEFESYYNRATVPCSYIPWEEDKQGYYHYYIVEDTNKNILACLGINIFSRVATEVTSSLSPEAYEKKIPAQDLLHWIVILSAKSMGCHIFDLAGVSPNPHTPKERGIKLFKKKWGGRYVEYYTYKKEMFPTHIIKLLNRSKNLIFSFYGNRKSKLTP